MRDLLRYAAFGLVLLQLGSSALMAQPAAPVEEEADASEPRERSVEERFRCHDRSYFVPADDLRTEAAAETVLGVRTFEHLRAWLVEPSRLDPPALDYFGRPLPAVASCLAAQRVPSTRDLPKSISDTFAWKLGYENSEVFVGVVRERITGTGRYWSPVAQRARVEVKDVYRGDLARGTDFYLLSKGGTLEIGDRIACSPYSTHLPQLSVGDEVLVVTARFVSCEVPTSASWQALGTGAFEAGGSARPDEAPLVRIVLGDAELHSWLQNRR